MKSLRGLTIIEILIVAAIFALLAMIIVPNFVELRNQSRLSRARVDLRRLATAAEAYAVDVGEYPPNHHLEFDFKEILAPLSTPVAYLNNAHMPDAFGNLAYPDTGSQWVYYYFNYNASEDVIWRIFGEVLEYTDEDLAELISFEYVIISVGPDQLAEFDRSQPPFGIHNGLGTIDINLGRGLITRSVIYDPTNGASSIGDIVLTHRGFLDEAPRVSE